MRLDRDHPRMHLHYSNYSQLANMHTYVHHPYLHSLSLSLSLSRAHTHVHTHTHTHTHLLDIRRILTHIYYLLTSYLLCSCSHIRLRIRACMRACVRACVRMHFKECDHSRNG
jgi:hypothetical protein